MYSINGADRVCTFKEYSGNETRKSLKNILKFKINKLKFQENMFLGIVV